MRKFKLAQFHRDLTQEKTIRLVDFENLVQQSQALEEVLAGNKVTAYEVHALAYSGYGVKHYEIFTTDDDFREVLKNNQKSTELLLEENKRLQESIEEKTKRNNEMSSEIYLLNQKHRFGGMFRGNEAFKSKSFFWDCLLFQGDDFRYLSLGLFAWGAIIAAILVLLL